MGVSAAPAGHLEAADTERNPDDRQAEHERRRGRAKGVQSAPSSSSGNGCESERHHTAEVGQSGFDARINLESRNCIFP